MKKIITIFLILFSVTAAKCSDYYWVGGTGNWTDYGTHWATSSGGSVFHTTIPSPLDNVHFDANSFSATGQSVNAVSATIYAKDLDLTGTLYNPSFVMQGTILNIYGSLTLISPMVFNVGHINFMTATGISNITTAGNHMPQNVSFIGNATWNLQDDLAFDIISFVELTVSGGNFLTNNHAINIGNNNNFSTFRISSGAQADFGSSVVTCFEFDLSSNNFNAGTSQINSRGINIDCSTATLYDVNSEDVSIANPVTPLAYTFRNVTAGFANLINCTVQNLICGGSITGHNNFIHNAIMYGAGSSIGNSNTFDSLQFINTTSTIDFSGVNTINNYLKINSSPAFPVTVKNGTIQMSTGTVCTDYIWLQNSTVTGGASFFAGDNSIDLGGNSGWSFTSCNPVMTDVWPGDANGDLVANNMDILDIGLAYGNGGTTRAAANTSWTAQPSLTWNAQFINGTNLNSADCDGNGIIDALDTNAVSLNYGLTHPRPLNPPALTSTGSLLYLDFPAVNIPAGSVISVPVKFGDGSTLVLVGDMYGVAFTIDYDAAMIQPGSVNITYPNSWLSAQSNCLHLEKDFPLNGKTDIAFCRTDHRNVEGSGTIAFFNFTVANNASGILQLGLSNIKAVSASQMEVPVQTQPLNIVTGIKNINNTSSSVIVYPDPVDDYLFFTSADINTKNIFIYDFMGKVVLNEKINDNKIFTGNLSPGMYLLKITDKNGKEIVSKKILKK